MKIRNISPDALQIEQKPGMWVEVEPDEVVEVDDAVGEGHVWRHEGTEHYDGLPEEKDGPKKWNKVPSDLWVEAADLVVKPEPEEVTP